MFYHRVLLYLFAPCCLCIMLGAWAAPAYGQKAKQAIAKEATGAVPPSDAGAPPLKDGAARPAQAEEVAAQKTVKSLINAIRYGKSDLAISKLAVDDMAKALMADAWPTMSDAQKNTFRDSFVKLLAETSFIKGKDLFRYLDALLFAPAYLEGQAMHVKSTAVVHRELKKVEIPIEWRLVKTGTTYKVVDIISMGDSTLEGVREEEVKPLLKEGGATKVLAALKERLAHNTAAKASTGAAL